MTSGWWTAVGFGGQILFGLRFVAQWIASERKGYSVVPPVFWLLSVPAGFMIFLYAIWRRDPVFVVGEGACILIFMRNIWFLTGKSLKDAKKPELSPSVITEIIK